MSESQDCETCGTTFPEDVFTCPTCGATVKTPSVKYTVRQALDEVLAKVGDPSFFESTIEAVRDMVVETLSDEPDSPTVTALEELRLALATASMAAYRYEAAYWRGR